MERIESSFLSRKNNLFERKESSFLSRKNNLCYREKDKSDTRLGLVLLNEDLTNIVNNGYIPNSINAKFNNSWNLYFTKNTKFEISTLGLNKLKQEIFMFYVSMFCFNEKEIEIKKNYIIGKSSANEVDEILNQSVKNELVRVFSQTFIKEEISKINKTSDFFKMFKHYFIHCLSKSFEIGKIKNKYHKTKFKFESIKSVVDKLYQKGKIFDNQLNQEEESNKYTNHIEEKSNDMKIEILNDEKIPKLFYVLNELNNDEKNFCAIKELKDENGSYYQGKVTTNEMEIEKFNNSKSMSFSNNKSINNNMNKHGLGREYHIELQSSDDIRYKYLGYYKNNKFHGYGILIKENGECYYGEFRDGEKNGFGMLYSKTEVYRGFFYYDKKEGFGEYFNKVDGLNYCGNFSNDKYNGYGFYTDNKFKYFGNFTDGHLNGMGFYIWNCDNQYYGNWSNDKMNGFGIYLYNGGDIYIGNYLNDKKNGNGKFIYGGIKAMLEGDWKNGIKNGIYKFTSFLSGKANSTDIRYIDNKEIN